MDPAPRGGARSDDGVMRRSTASLAGGRPRRTPFDAAPLWADTRGVTASCSAREAPRRARYRSCCHPHRLRARRGRWRASTRSRAPPARLVHRGGEQLLESVRCSPGWRSRTRAVGALAGAQGSGGEPCDSGPAGSEVEGAHRCQRPVRRAALERARGGRRARHVLISGESGTGKESAPPCRASGRSGPIHRAQLCGAPRVAARVVSCSARGESPTESPPAREIRARPGHPVPRRERRLACRCSHAAEHVQGARWIGSAAASRFASTPGGSATHRSLNTVRDGRFREDLYRLRVWLELPPLRRARETSPTWCQFAASSPQRGPRGPAFEREACCCLHGIPGNVREGQNVSGHLARPGTRDPAAHRRRPGRSLLGAGSGCRWREDGLGRWS